MFIKNCPTCKKEMEYTTARGLKRAIKRNSNCRKCANLKVGQMAKGRLVSKETALKISQKNTGKKHSDEARKKISEGKIGKTFSISHKENLSKSKKGCKFSENHRKNISKSLTGLKHTSEAIINISISKMGDKNPAKQDWVKEKIRNSIIKLYKENPEIKEKISKTLFKYFQDHPNYVDIEELSKFRNYRRVVNNLTKRNKKELLKNWDGYDYYDKENIIDNFKLHKNDNRYPSIDHKISVINGFKNKIIPEEISSISNLCITKRYLNSQKNILNEDQFLEKLYGEN